MYLLKMVYVHSRSEELVSQTTVVLILFKIWNAISYQDNFALILCIVLSLGFPSLEQSAQENQLVKRQICWGSQCWDTQEPLLETYGKAGLMGRRIWQDKACCAREHRRVPGFRITFKHMATGKEAHYIIHTFHLLTCCCLQEPSF